MVIAVPVQATLVSLLQCVRCCIPALVTDLQFEMSRLSRVSETLESLVMASWARPASLIFQHLDRPRWVSWVRNWVM